jgi:hypothetical protein
MICPWGHGANKIVQEKTSTDALQNAFYIHHKYWERGHVEMKATIEKLYWLWLMLGKTLLTKYDCACP